MLLNQFYTSTGLYRFHSLLNKYGKLFSYFKCILRCDFFSIGNFFFICLDVSGPTRESARGTRGSRNLVVYHFVSLNVSVGVRCDLSFKQLVLQPINKVGPVVEYLFTELVLQLTIGLGELTSVDKNTLVENRL